MSSFHLALQYLSTLVFMLVGLVAFRRWIRLRGRQRGLLALAFVLLAIASATARMLPVHTDDPTLIFVRKLLVAVLVFFPYLLFRFAATFGRVARWLEATTAALTAGLASSIFLLGKLPEQGGPRSPAFQIYVIVLLVQWTLCSMFVTVRFWKAGKGQPTVARRRMRTLSLGALALAVALLIGGSSGPQAEPGGIQIATSLLGILSAPLFLLGFAPPRFVVALWRRPEELLLREAGKGLMRAGTPQEVASIVLPHAARLFGASSAILTESEGQIVGHVGTSQERAAKIVSSRHLAQDESLISVPVGTGQLFIEASPFAPYFGREDIEILGALGNLTDLGLTRTRQTAELEAATEAMRDFVAIASHDMRTPITVIKGMALTLRDRWEAVPPESRHRHLDSIVRNAGYLATLVDDLLTVSKLESGSMGADPIAVDVAIAARQILEDLKEYNFEIRIPENLRALVDPAHLERILINYVVNARTYGEPPYRIEASTKDRSMHLTVVDHGPGVPIAFEPRLFEKFARAEKQESKVREGTGLGLSIVRGLARAAGGDAWHERVEPSGSRFCVRLPGI